MRFLTWAVFVVLATAADARANVATVISPDDPGYTRARVASAVAPALLVTSVVLAFGWVSRTRSAGARVAALAFGLMVLGCGGVTFLTAPTEFPAERPKPGSGVAGMSFRRSDGATPEELAVAGVFGFAAVTLGGLALARVVTGYSSHDSGADAPTRTPPE